MKRLVVGVFLLGFFGFLGVIATPSNASAAVTINGYGTGYVGSTRYDVKNQTQATAFLKALCDSSGYGHPVAVIGFPSNMSLNESNGRMSYTANIMWRSCSDSNATRAFAITGYPDSEPGSLATCPNAGTYALPQTYDCIKYTLSDGGHLTGYSTLGCPAGSGYTCVTGGSNPAGTFRSVIERIEKGPPTSAQLSRQSMGGTVPNWSTETLKSGSYPFNRAGAFCTFYKYNSNGSDGYANCTALRIDVSWTRPNYTLTPTITSPSANTVIESDSGAKTITGFVANAGPTASNPSRWQLTQAVYSPGTTVASIPNRNGGSSANDPCAYFTSSLNCGAIGSGTNVTYETSGLAHSAPTNIGPYPTGTKICYALSVKDRKHDDTNWQHSAIVCFIIGKSPKVNIIGGDLLVGRSVTGSSPTISGRVITSRSTNSTGMYGSWGEYAIIPSGPVTNMSSGSATVNGNQTNLNLLTFANQGVASASCGTLLGCFTQAGALPNVASRFRTSSSTPLVSSGSLTSVARGVYRAGSSLTIDASTIQAGKWIVINSPTTNVTITGNINYATGPFTSATQIPQLIIIANTITIKDSVQNVDAWLVAPGAYTGSTVTGGVIRTCDLAPSTISSDVCSAPLTINGPVIAYRLVMLRTGGANEGTQAGEPAERFNFRPDAYLWGLGQGEASGRVTTVSTKELPPRY